LNHLLKSPPWIRNVSEKPKRIQQVRFAARVRPNDEHPLAKGNIDLLKVSPVLEQQPRQTHV